MGELLGSTSEINKTVALKFFYFIFFFSWQDCALQLIASFLLKPEHQTYNVFPELAGKNINMVPSRVLEYFH